jgi:hypothetical protein
LYWRRAVFAFELDRPIDRAAAVENACSTFATEDKQMTDTTINHPFDYAEIFRNLFLTEKQVVQMIIGLKRETLSQWRKRSIGPRYEKVNGAIRYRYSDLLAWTETFVLDPKTQIAVPKRRQSRGKRGFRHFLVTLTRPEFEALLLHRVERELEAVFAAGIADIRLLVSQDDGDFIGRLRQHEKK